MYKQTQKTKKQKMTSVLSFFLLCARKHKNGKTKIDFRFMFVRFLYEQTQKTEKRQMTSFLSFFLLRTKTHENIQTDIDFPSIVFRCKYDQSVKERTGYNLIFRLYIFFVFSGCLSEPRAGTERGSRELVERGLVVSFGNSSRCCWSAVFITVGCVFFLGSFKNGGDGKRSYCSLREGAC